MDTLQSSAHLQRSLGVKLFSVIIDPANISEVRELAKKIIVDALPEEIKVGDRLYKVMPFHRSTDGKVDAEVLFLRPEGADPSISEHREHILAHQDDLPGTFLRWFGCIVVTDGEPPYNAGAYGYVYSNDNRWK